MCVWMCDCTGVLLTLQRLPVDRRHKSPRPPSHLRHRKPAKEGEETPSESEKETPSASEAESEAEDSQGKRRRWVRIKPVWGIKKFAKRNACDCCGYLGR